MPDAKTPLLSLKAMFSEREAQRERERAQEDQLSHRKAEELAAFRKRLETFRLTDEARQTVVERIKRAFERGETELLLTSFPSEFCTDDGRAINNAGAPSINPHKTEEGVPDWLKTLPAGAIPVYEFWKNELEPGGFKFSARIIDFPGGKPGNVGLFFSWPKSTD